MSRTIVLFVMFCFCVALMCSAQAQSHETRQKPRKQRVGIVLTQLVTKIVTKDGEELPASTQSGARAPVGGKRSTSAVGVGKQVAQPASIYGGIWRGRTRTGREIEFKVSDTGDVEELKVEGAIELGWRQGMCTFKFIQKSPARIRGGIARIPVIGLPSLSCGLTVNVTFTSPNSCKGRVPICRGKTIICGGTMAVTTGIYKSEAETWEASRVKSLVAPEKGQQLPTALARSAVLSQLW